MGMGEVDSRQFTVESEEKTKIGTSGAEARLLANAYVAAEAATHKALQVARDVEARRSGPGGASRPYK
jgi:hypothetical protein